MTVAPEGAAVSAYSEPNQACEGFDRGNSHLFRHMRHRGKLPHWLVSLSPQLQIY